MSYRTVAPLVLVVVPAPPGGERRVDYHYEGSVIPALTDEQADRFLKEGLVEVVDGSEPPSDTKDGGRPRKTATQKSWADYAVSQGADRAEADAASREDLIALYGG